MENMISALGSFIHCTLWNIICASKRALDCVAVHFVSITIRRGILVFDGPNIICSDEMRFIYIFAPSPWPPTIPSSIQITIKSILGYWFWIRALLFVHWKWKLCKYSNNTIYSPNFQWKLVLGSKNRLDTGEWLVK